MAAHSPLWPARLHHLAFTSPQPEALAAFYARAFGDRVEALGEGRLPMAHGASNPRISVALPGRSDALPARLRGRKND